MDLCKTLLQKCKSLEIVWNPYEAKMNMNVKDIISTGFKNNFSIPNSLQSHCPIFQPPSALVLMLKSRFLHC